MPVNYREVLKDIEAKIADLETEIGILRSSRDGLIMLAEKQPLSNSELFGPAAADQKYASLGTTAAVRDVLKDGQLMTREEIATKLKAGGWSTDASSPLSILSATLAQARDIEKVGDRFRRKRDILFHGGSVSVVHDSVKYGGDKHPLDTRS